MEKVIEVDFDIRWAVPVFVRIGNGFRERIDGPKAALEALIYRWPSQSQAEYAVAKCRCSDAIRHHGSAELARRTFIDAAVAAKVFS
ncbi:MULTISPECIES: DUF982 domain-containing protein [Rhizobium]|uniref:DUF982 domain-containing protein n=1 Tax=Rhizobium TaxID=379 RepID=UPI0014422610|nr:MULTISPECIES: DUF982 domain-containing protein [Rhizobium]MBY3036326.1 DUF982 domain-containing protein [Rhizobium laguerreae]MBY3172372.1 DUF982 domain-containing protein [Rhizobium laguerreae]MBY3198908.1 DUF982 domain-containing protein [Rhizobium laguerreae]MBY3211704.1 DUF982 domain-containing protein [Rhizobium laguerreae]MBY3216409.1 DUF982 domain-containing protein [Rhizobium laguerreae]